MRGEYPFGDRSTIPGILASAPTSAERHERLRACAAEAAGCARCPQLAASRTQVVFGAGAPDAPLMVVGGAPGAIEDREGVPLGGAAGALLDELLGEIGLARADVYVTNVLRCRPPGNRDPAPAEVEQCRMWLERTVELVRPRVVCALGGFAARLLGEPAPIARTHGRAQTCVIGGRAVRLLPVYHPAAALYTPAMLATLRRDMALLPGLLALAPVAQPVFEPAPAAEPEPAAPPDPPPPSDGQLGLF